VQLTVVGCAGTFPGPDSPCSCYLFEAEGFRLLVDAGNGSTGELQRSIGLLDIDATIISHLHGDHYLDLITYTYARKFHPAGDVGPLPLHAPRGTLDQLAGSFARDVYELLESVYDIHELDGGKLEVGPFTVEMDRMAHPVETFGMRVSHAGKTVAYSADTGPCEELAGIAKDADLFLCEASFLDGEDNPPDLHLTGREAGEYATRGNAGLLVLTHLVPWGDPVRTLQEAHDTFSGDIALATSRARFEI
jgi:ribonuclease BN (tRNA processing enzyme)